ncbi:RodZ domain-containing protein [Salinicola halimionae]|uniref:RodZ domain-containing protein n=1 Tax=Salinicola halimionae TaxID=1949081 RepID=UPI000DA15402|nr:RodZ domain-containing protein [Salinicola halimionae]
MSEMNEPSVQQHDVPSPSQEMAGHMLQSERERQGLSLEDVALQLNLRPVVVAGLEEDRFDQVPIAAYRRGYVRAYARLLGMDETRVVNAYDATHGRGDMERKLAPVHTTRAPSRVGPWIFRLFTLLVIIGLISLTLLWWQSREGNDIFGGGSDDSPIAVDRLNDDGSGAAANTGDATDSGAAGSGISGSNASGTNGSSSAMAPNTDTQLPPLPNQQNTPATDIDAAASNDAAETGGATGVSASAETAPPNRDERQAAQASSAAVGDDTAAAGASDNSLSLTFSEESWTEIYDANDDRIFSGLQSADSQATAEGEPPFRLTIGNASGVTLEYRGKSIDLGQYTGGNNVARFTLGD